MERSKFENRRREETEGGESEEINEEVAVKGDILNRGVNSSPHISSLHDFAFVFGCFLEINFARHGHLSSILPLTHFLSPSI